MGERNRQRMEESRQIMERDAHMLRDALHKQQQREEMIDRCRKSIQDLQVQRTEVRAKLAQLQDANDSAYDNKNQEIQGLLDLIRYENEEQEKLETALEIASKEIDQLSKEL